MSRLHLFGLLVLLATWGCASDSPASSPDGSPGSGADGSPGGADGGALTPDGAVPEAWSFSDVAGVPNLDDDDGSLTDWQQAPFPGDNDLSLLVLSSGALDALPPGYEVELSLSGEAEMIRLYRAGEQVLGGAGELRHSFEPPGGDVTLEVEFGDYGVAGTLTVSAIDGAGVTAKTHDVRLRAAPLIMNHHLQPAEHLWAVNVGDNAAFLDAYETVLGSDFTTVHGPTYNWDVWIQDEFEFGTLLGAGGQRIDVVIDSIRDRGLDDFPEDALVGPDVIAPTWGSSWSATTYDSFGNLEASPPVTAGGVEYPFGRIYYGKQDNSGLDSALGGFLASQEAQAPFELPTSWLCVGHVDEYSTFVPDPSSPKGFKLLLADTKSGWQLLESLPADMPIGRYGPDHGYSTVGELLSHAHLEALNEAVQFDYLDPIRERFKEELGLEDSDIIEIPSLFEEVSGCGNRVAALIPGMVNLIVANVDGQTTHLFIPDPFFRSSQQTQADDPVLAEFAARMPDELELHFIDNWDVYHLGLGEVHCGTNVQRTPTAEWWTAMPQLMGGE